ncbi:MAG: PAS domain-containing sensor histidine kinase [Gemmatimonadota bacterium]
MAPRLLPAGGLRRVLDVLGDGHAIVWEAGAEPGLFTSVSNTVEELLGSAPREWVDDPASWLARVHPDDRDRVVGAWTDAAEGERLDVEYRFENKDGDELRLWHVGHLVPATVRSKAKLRGLIVDVTERRRIELEQVEALRDASEGRTREAASRWVEAEERFRALEEQVPAITYLDAIDGPQKTLAISEQTTTILGYAPDDWYADPELWDKIVHPDDKGRLEAAGRTGGLAGGIEYRAITKDGRTVWLHDRSRLITDGEGVPRYWLGVLVDVSDRRRVHELRHELASERAQNLRLSATDEAKTIAIQAVSHDIRTPLAAILGLAVTLEHRAEEMSADDVRDLSSRIVQNSRRLDRIVTDLLDLDRLQRKGFAARLRPVDLGTLVRQLVTRTDAVTERRLQLDTGPVHVEADPTMVERIIENLLANAVKHTPGDSRIWVRVERTDDGALIVVEDDGPGIPPEDRERIFEPFVQGSSPGPGGAGVGLALVVKFAELHDGRAWVQERTGGGSSFRVLLAFEPEENVLVIPQAPQETDTDSSPEDSQA